MVLTGSGYHVVDCGKDCPLRKLIDAAEKERPLAIGISGLITPIIPLVRQVKDQLLLRGLGAGESHRRGRGVEAVVTRQTQRRFRRPNRPSTASIISMDSLGPAHEQPGTDRRGRRRFRNRTECRSSPRCSAMPPRWPACLWTTTCGTAKRLPAANWRHGNGTVMTPSFR